MATSNTTSAKSTKPATGRGRKVTPKSTATTAKPQGGSQKATEPKKTLAELFAIHAVKARTAAELAKLCGVEDDIAFRRAVTHHSQGSRVLAAHKAKFVRENDSAVYVERRPVKAKTAAPTPNLAEALEKSVEQVKRGRKAPAKPKAEKPLTRAAKARALVAEGLAENLADARQQLADMAE
jgi:hypothetical protein